MQFSKNLGFSVFGFGIKNLTLVLTVPPMCCNQRFQYVLEDLHLIHTHCLELWIQRRDTPILTINRCKANKQLHLLPISVPLLFQVPCFFLKVVEGCAKVSRLEEAYNIMNKDSE